MNNKETPLALRLADLESMHERGTIRRGHIDEMLAELRRLHAVNAELVEALEEVLSDVDSESYLFDGGNGLSVLTYDQAKAALNKAKEQT